MSANIQGDFQICISVPLNKALSSKNQKEVWYGKSFIASLIPLKTYQAKSE